jgi:hypothetical protein
LTDSVRLRPSSEKDPALTIAGRSRSSTTRAVSLSNWAIRTLRKRPCWLSALDRAVAPLMSIAIRSGPLSTKLLALSIGSLKCSTTWLARISTLDTSPAWTGAAHAIDAQMEVSQSMAILCPRRECPVQCNFMIPGFLPDLLMKARLGLSGKNLVKRPG